MRRFWHAIEIIAYVGFCLELVAIWMTVGVPGPIGYDTPVSSLWLPVCAIIAGFARDRRGRRPYRLGDYPGY